MHPHVDPWKCGTQISENLWIQELKKKGALESPLFNGVPDREAHARECYRYIKANPPHSAEVILNVAGREHSWGTNHNSVLHRNDTRSFTNARSIRHPELKGSAKLIEDSQRDGYYVKYATALDSIKDALYRVDEPGYAYQKANAVTIAQVVTIWAPKDDSNDPEGYAWFVANGVAGLRSRMTPMVPGGNWPLIPFVAADRRHFTRGRTVAWADLLGQHHTDGWDSLHWLTRSPNSDVSATYLNNHDGTPRAQLVKHEDTPHTSGRIYNPRSITSEWERKWPEQRGVLDTQYRNLGRFWAQVILVERARGNPNFQQIPKRSQMYGHNDIASTTCPGDLSIDTLFASTLEALAAFDSRPDTMDMRKFSDTGRYLYGGFRALYEEIEQIDVHLAGRVCGPPVTDEGWALIKGERRRIQFFIKAIMVWNEQLSDPYDITYLNRDEWEQIDSFEEDRVAA